MPLHKKTEGQVMSRRPSVLLLPLGALFYFRFCGLMISRFDCFVRRLAVRHHSGFDPESRQDNGLQQKPDYKYNNYQKQLFHSTTSRT
jgi:hypothetical protein